MTRYKDIFVVDDDKIYHFILRNLFERSDICGTTSFFENGQDALERLKTKIVTNEYPDLILLDINMPIMDGWQFLEEYRKLKQTHNIPTKVYMVTSSVDVVDQNRARTFEAEIAKYYVKPINERDLSLIFAN